MFLFGLFFSIVYWRLVFSQSLQEGDFVFSDFLSVLDRYTVWIRELIRTLNSHWLTQILLFLFVLDIIVSLLIVFRGGR